MQGPAPGERFSADGTRWRFDHAGCPPLHKLIKVVSLTYFVCQNLHSDDVFCISAPFVPQHCRNWVSSPEPLDTPLEPMLPDCPRVSAGTEPTLALTQSLVFELVQQSVRIIAFIIMLFDTWQNKLFFLGSLSLCFIRNV